MKLTSRVKFVLAFWLGLASLQGQTQSQLTGAVADVSGAIIVAAAVSVRNLETGVTQSATTNASGIYTFPSLPPGRYEFSSEMRGFKKLVRRGDVVLETGLATRIDIVLEVGSVTEVMEVSAASPILESENSSLGALIERTTVRDMPVESRRSGSLVRLLGGVIYTSETAQESIPHLSVAGGRSDNQMYALDGAVAQNIGLGTAFLVLNPPTESLQEFRVETNNYPSEFGRAGSGLILMTTRSGTNQYHGAAYEFLRNDKLDARSFFAPSKAPRRYNIFGTSLGGRIIRDKTFFFANFEGTRRRDGLTFASNIVPHPAEINGDFSARRDLNVLDPATGTPFPNNIIPANRIDPVGQGFARFYPAPNIPNNDVTRAPRNNYVTNVSDALTQNFLTAKVDHNWGANNRFYGRLSYMNAVTDTANVYPERFADYRAEHRPLAHTNMVGSWTRLFGPSLVNEGRYNIGNRPTHNVEPGTTSGVNAKLGLRGVDPDAFATISVSGLSGLGRSPHGRDQYSLTQQFIDTLTWIRGKHQIKTGVEFRYSRNRDIFNTSGGGAFNFDSRATNFGLASLLLGWTTSGQRVTTDEIVSRTDFYGAFVQDDWKVSQRLTLNVGLRWDLDTPRWETQNRQSGFDGKAINPVAGVPGVVTFAGRNGAAKYAHDFDRNNFGPRFGFAYRAGQNTVARGGYGIFYLGAYVNVVVALTNGFGNNALFTSPDGGFTPAFLFRTGLPAAARDELGPGFGAVPLGRSPRLSTGFIDQNHPNGYSQQWNLAVQRTLSTNISVELAYMANVSHKMAANNLDINMIPLANGRGPARQDQQLRLYPQFSAVTWYSPPWGDSSYHAFNVKVEQRYSGGLNFGTNLTWSKFLDNAVAGSELAANAGSGYTHPELRGLDKSHSGNDIRLRWVASAVYELPFGRGKRFQIDNPAANAIAGGWGLGVISEMRTGAPYGVIELTNRSNAFSSTQRPNLLRNPELDSGRSRGEFVARYFDTTAFEAPGVGVFGNAARNVSFGPGFAAIDLSVQKNWSLKERARLQFRADFYNLTNRPNFTNPATLRERGDFGQISNIVAGSGGRLIQFGLRLEF